MNGWIKLSIVVAGFCTLNLMSGCSGGSTAQTNDFSNGFRLVSETVDNLLFDSLDYVRVVEYDSDSSSAVSTETSFSDGTEKTRTGILEFDSAGRLTSEGYSSDSVEFDTEFSYDSAGRLTEYVGVNGRQVFSYSDELLREISYTRHDGLIVDVKTTFSYNSDSRIISTQSMLEGTVTTYEYDSENRVVSASDSTITGMPQFTTRYEYDVHANLSKETITRQFGDIYQINEYVYEEISEPTYNHNLMKLALQPFNYLIFSFLR
ncbi:RHS repeat protein [Granulosicoccus sp.]|nr:RHS repeat protein [Granulosicoccus sp.]